MRTKLLLASAAFAAGLTTAAPAGSLTVSEWLKSVNDRLEVADPIIGEVQWAYSTNVTDETAAAQDAASIEYSKLPLAILSELAEGGYEAKATTFDEKRLISLLKAGSITPKSNATQAVLAKTLSDMSSVYASGKFEGKDLDELSGILAESRDYEELKKVYLGWREVVGRAEKPLYEKFVKATNEGARDNGYADTGAAWRDGYDMTPEDFMAMMSKALGQVQPLYEQLHCYAKAKLSDLYGKEKIMTADGTIPAHVFGNMWSQDWGNIESILRPYPDVQAVDVTEELVKQGYDAVKMHRLSEEFYTSLGMEPMPESFWTKSMLVKPADGRTVECHASAWDFYNGDVRIKMCTRINHEDLMTVHHEQGHIYYDLQYKDQPVPYRTGASDFFHEAIGDTMQLSVLVPKHLKEVGLITKELTDGLEQTINFQMAVALDKIVSMPWTYLLDQWRWDVYSGKTTPDMYQKAYWDLIEKHQGLSRPAPSTAEDFDAGAKYHVPANTPYIRYFGANMLQFQFHAALCKAAGHTGPLHECSIYKNKAAGAQFKKMLAMGRSKTWQEAMSVGTGGMYDSVDGTAVVDYFAPLMTFLKEFNAKSGVKCGWTQAGTTPTGPPTTTTSTPGPTPTKCHRKKAAKQH
ncbi:peptidyl-dipeptidase A [Fimicolochytrium jonesii]|uniref:peptidyl-dipeptidase A n=1 Tax=Fimicolochytrium jonesii TaxID=1396493 RepID=UPI0022FF22A7|nr:peptidyl-dipeptidase A [Fimicolochytrium jonesii]KAI8821282.1 peptidyl-dipeptidase A [Fimicolochytrium jonesii]